VLIRLACLVNSPCKAVNLCFYLFAPPKYSNVIWIFLINAIDRTLNICKETNAVFVGNVGIMPVHVINNNNTGIN
jgi:hypothetical protein